MKLKTRYPILLLHGLNCNDFKPIAYWGRIPEYLEKNGTRVYFGGQDAWGSIEKNAENIKQKIETILETTGCQKINIIAHSKGGLEARYLITKLNMSSDIASLTTISTPHYGLKTLDKMYQHPNVMKVVSKLINGYARLIGDQNPDSFSALYQLTDQYCKTFNQHITDAKSVYYQSYSNAINRPHDDLSLWFSHCFIKKYDGENDGFVPVSSMKWGHCYHIKGVDDREGVSHQNIVDARKRNVKGFDPFTFYEGIITNLIKKGL